MNAQQILSASSLDILFDGRNKMYGAYSLRKDYNRRLTIALSTTFSIVATLFVITYFHPAGHADLPSHPPAFPEYAISNIPQELTKPPQPPKPTRRQTRLVRTEHFAGPPKIVSDPPPAQRMPDVNDLDNARIGTIVREGFPEDQFGPPAQTGAAITPPPAKQPGDVAGGVIPIEKESSFPGGIEAWKRFLNRTLNYPERAKEVMIEGRIIVRFIVDVNGSVSDVEVLSGPEELRDEATRVIRKSGKWIPAVQNGIPVKSYKQQPIVFQLTEE